MKHIISVFNFACLIGCTISVDENIIVFKGRQVDKMIISYKN